jgi:KRAB domain-containing zinc finger protein
MEYELDNHIKQVHENAEKKKFHCLECDKKFSCKSKLKIHVSAVHQNSKPFACDICNMKFTQKGGLMNHEKEIHAKTKTECPKCKKSFGNPRSVYLHDRTVHLGLKPYKCQDCQKKFGLQFNLKKHLKTKHNKMIIYSCFHCPETFDQLKSYQLHLENDHDFECQKSSENNNKTVSTPKAEDFTQKKITNYFCNVTINE